MIKIDANQTSAPLRQPWKNCITVGRAYDLTRADLLAHLRWLQDEIGFRSCRFHAVFHDDMAVVRRRRDGSLVYQWHHVDKVYDALLALGLKPFVELNSMPAALASGDQTIFHYKMNVTPPRKMSEWHDLVHAFTQHCVERYGLAEVLTWHFEVWNEPNLSAFWSGTKEEYFDLYAHAARAIKKVDAGLRVGGPASSKANWLVDLINFCNTQDVPLDFISTHLYPQDEFVEFADRAASPYQPGEFFGKIVREAQAEVAASVMPHLPIHWTEWNTMQSTSAADLTWFENRYVDSLHGGSFVARNMIELDDVANTMAFWCASDIFEESPIPNAPFSCTYGLVTIHGFPKATANAFRLLNRLRGPRLALRFPDTMPVFCGGVATRECEAIHLMFWHDVPPEIQTATNWTAAVDVILPATSAHDQWVVTKTQIRTGAGSAFETWEAIGSPLNLSKTQFAMLRAQSEPEACSECLRSFDSELNLNFTLRPNEVIHIELMPLRQQATSKTADMSLEESAKGEAQLGEQSRD